MEELTLGVVTPWAEAPVEAKPAKTLNFQPLELQGNGFLSLQPPGLWTSVGVLAGSCEGISKGL